MKKLRSRMSLFSRDARQTSAPHSSGPDVVEACRKLQSWGSQVELVEKLEKGLENENFFCFFCQKPQYLDTLYIIRQLAVSKLLASSRRGRGYSW